MTLNPGKVTFFFFLLSLLCKVYTLNCKLQMNIERLLGVLPYFPVNTLVRYVVIHTLFSSPASAKRASPLWARGHRGHVKFYLRVIIC